MSAEKIPRWQYDCGHCKMRWNCGPRCACFPSMARFKIDGEADNARNYPKNKRWFHVEIRGTSGPAINVDAEVTPAVPTPGTIIRYQEAGEEPQEAYFVRGGQFGSLVCVRPEEAGGLVLLG